MYARYVYIHGYYVCVLCLYSRACVVMHMRPAMLADANTKLAPRHLPVQLASTWPGYMSALTPHGQIN
jgi:disulfide bond formation protein DsbB